MLEQGVRALKIRTAWSEKDLLFAKVEQAERTIAWMTIEDRRLTIEKAFDKAGVGGMDELARISILAVPSLTEDGDGDAQSSQPSQERTP